MSVYFYPFGKGFLFDAPASGTFLYFFTMNHTNNRADKSSDNIVIIGIDPSCKLHYNLLWIPTFFLYERASPSSFSARRCAQPNRKKLDSTNVPNRIQLDGFIFIYRRMKLVTHLDGCVVAYSTKLNSDSHIQHCIT